MTITLNNINTKFNIGKNNMNISIANIIGGTSMGGNIDLINSGNFAYSGTKYFGSSNGLLNNEIKGSTSKFSISIWCQRTTVDATVQTIFSRDSNTGGRQFACEWVQQEYITFFIANDASNYTWWQTDATFTETNAWYHIVYTFDNTLSGFNKCKIYVNGQVETTGNVVIAGTGVTNVNDQPSEPIYLCRTDFGGLINQFKGSVGEIDFYTGVLSQSDVTALFNSGTYKNAQNITTSIAPYMNWRPVTATWNGSAWSMNDNVGTSYGTSKVFTSTGLLQGDFSSGNPQTTSRNSNTIALLTNMSVQPSLRDAYIIDSFIQNTINDGIWALFSDMGFFAAHDQQAARIRWLNPTLQVTEVNTPIWTQDQGYVTNAGVTAYINSGIDLSTIGGNFTLNSGGIGTYNRLNNNGNEASIGIVNGAGSIIIPRNSGSYAGRMNTTGSNNSVASADSRGLVCQVRSASNVMTAYQNGASINANATVSTAIPVGNIFILAFSNAGTAASISGNQISFWYVGSGSINQGTLYLRVQQYMRSKKTNV